MDDATDASSDAKSEETNSELPESAIDGVERLTRLARNAVDENEAAAYRARRTELLAEYCFTARVREDPDGGETLVCHPDEWLDDEGLVDYDAIEDTDRGIEVSLSGPGEQGTYDEAAAANRELVAAVRAEYGDIHAANARAFADFMSNHYATPIADAAGGQIREFLTEYYPRNAWPTDAERAVVVRSLRRVFEVVEKGRT